MNSSGNRREKFIKQKGNIDAVNNLKGNITKK